MVVVVVVVPMYIIQTIILDEVFEISGIIEMRGKCYPLRPKIGVIILLHCYKENTSIYTHGITFLYYRFPLFRYSRY